MTRDDRIAYVYLNLVDKKKRSAIYRIIEDIGITSTSTAQRTTAKIDKWSKSERELFLATFTPPEMDLCNMKDILEEKENDSLTEIATKNEELQKELHTSKNVIETLQKGIEELNETVTESKCMIAEVCKERDDKNEEIRVLSLELQKYKNDLNAVPDDRQNLECLLHDSIHNNDESKEFRDIIEKMIQLHTAKNKDYGNAFSQSYDEFGAVMAVIRINDKLNRYKTLIKQDSEIKTESVKDTLIDLANYAVMTIIEMEKNK